MTPPTTPPPHDHKPAYDFARSMRERADLCLAAFPPAVPYWKEWALVEAYMAGRAAAMAEAELAARVLREELGGGV